MLKLLERLTETSAQSVPFGGCLAELCQAKVQLTAKGGKLVVFGSFVPHVQIGTFGVVRLKRGNAPGPEGTRGIARSPLRGTVT